MGFLFKKLYQTTSKFLITKKKPTSNHNNLKCQNHNYLNSEKTSLKYAFFAVYSKFINIFQELIYKIQLSLKLKNILSFYSKDPKASS